MFAKLKDQYLSYDNNFTNVTIIPRGQKVKVLESTDKESIVLYASPKGVSQHVIVNTLLSPCDE